MDFKPKNRDWVKNAAIVFLAVLLVLTFFSQTIMNRTLPEVATQQVTDGTITAKVRGTGKVTAEGRYDVKGERTREIRAVMVKVGQEVKVGDVLFVLGEGANDDLVTAQEKLRTLETSYARTAAGIYYPNYEYDEIRIQDAKNAMDEAAKIVRTYESAEENENVKKLIAQRDAWNDPLDKAVEEEKRAQEAYDAAIRAAEDALTQAVLDRDAALRQLTLDGVTVIEPTVELWRFLYDGHSMEYVRKTDVGTADERWTFAIDTQTEDRYQITVDAFGIETKLETLSSGRFLYPAIPLTYSVRPDTNRANPLAVLLGGMSFTVLAGDPVGDVEDSGVMEVLADPENTAEMEPGPDVQTPSVGGAETVEDVPTNPTENPTNPAENPTNPTENPTNPAENPTNPAENPTNPTENPTNPTENPTNPTENPTNPAENPTSTAENPTNPPESTASPAPDPTEKPSPVNTIPSYIYAHIILYCKAEMGIQTAKYNLENVSRADLTAAEDEVLRIQSEINAIQTTIDQIMETLPTSAAYLAAKSSYQAARDTYNSMCESLENRQRTDAQTQSLAYIDLTDLAAQIEQQKEKIAELSGGEDNQILAKVNGIVQSLGCVAGDTKTKDDVLCTIEVPDRGYYLEFSVTNEQARRLRVGDTASVSNYYWGNQVQATLRSITVDPKNPQTNKILTFDLSGDVNSGADLTISVGQKSANYDSIIPNSAIRSDSNGTFVLVVESKNSPLGNRYIARRVEVEVLAADDNNSAVTGNFGYGSYVITTSNAPIKNGDLVRLADNG